MATATTDPLHEQVRMDQLHAGDLIAQDAVHIDGLGLVVATYRVTSPVGADPQFPHFLFVEQIDPAPRDGDEPGGFFAYPTHTPMTRTGRAESTREAP
jgi:hypothetical protein